MDTKSKAVNGGSTKATPEGIDFCHGHENRLSRVRACSTKPPLFFMLAVELSVVVFVNVMVLWLVILKYFTRRTYIGGHRIW